ncbi:hypothetical protein LA080_008052 [Diaporthe eres]|nr:hypothetical protein LA080_008052 [Diaporthe eres]
MVCCFKIPIVIMLAYRQVLFRFSVQAFEAILMSVKPITQYLVASAIGLKTRDHGTIVNMWLGEQARYTSQACVFSRMYINTKNAVMMTNHVSRRQYYAAHHSGEQHNSKNLLEIVIILVLFLNGTREPANTTSTSSPDHSPDLGSDLFDETLI